MTNKLFIMQGPPGCGKSTAIKNANLEKYVISTDALREIIDPSPLIYDEKANGVIESYDFSPMTSSVAFDMALKIMLTRMHRGQTIILDSTAGSRKTISKFLNAASDYNYDVYYVDMIGNLTLQEIQARNKSRGARAVPPMVVGSSYKRIKEYEYKNDERKISFNEMLSMARVDEPDITADYDKIIVVGDIQGCFDAFKDPRTLTIFAGDLLDRGPKNSQMFDWVQDRLEENASNIVFVRGNHDSYWRSFGHAELGPKLPSKTKASADQILNWSRHVFRKRQLLRQLSSKAYRAMVPFFAFRYAGKRWFVSHGGLYPSILEDSYDYELHEYCLGFASDQDMYYGTGSTIDRGDYEINIDELIRDYDGNGKDPIQIHGHRNEHSFGPYDGDGRVFNLEDGVEQGGHLRVLTIENRDGETSFKVDEYKEPVIVDWKDRDEARRLLNKCGAVLDDEAHARDDDSLGR